VEGWTEQAKTKLNGGQHSLEDVYQHWAVTVVNVGIRTWDEAGRKLRLRRDQLTYMKHAHIDLKMARNYLQWLREELPQVDQRCLVEAHVRDWLLSRKLSMRKRACKSIQRWHNWCRRHKPGATQIHSSMNIPEWKDLWKPSWRDRLEAQRDPQCVTTQDDKLFWGALKLSPSAVLSKCNLEKNKRKRDQKAASKSNHKEMEKKREEREEQQRKLALSRISRIQLMLRFVRISGARPMEATHLFDPGVIKAWTDTNEVARAIRESHGPTEQPNRKILQELIKTFPYRFKINQSKHSKKERLWLIPMVLGQFATEAIAAQEQLLLDYPNDLAERTHYSRNPGRLRGHWKRWLAKACPGAGQPFYDYRRTVASRMRAKGLYGGIMEQAGEVARHALGHWRVGTTKHYLRSNYDISLIMPEREGISRGHDYG